MPSVLLTGNLLTEFIFHILPEQKLCFFKSRNDLTSSSKAVYPELKASVIDG